MILSKFFHPVKKFMKGIFAIFTFSGIIFSAVIIFDSCKKNNYESSAIGKANAQFFSALKSNEISIGSISLNSKTEKSSTVSESNSSAAKESLSSYSALVVNPIYLNFPNGVNAGLIAEFDNINTIQELNNVMHQTNAIVQYEQTPSNSNYQLEVPIEQVVTSLNPMVQESKKYLYSKGFTELEIQQMIMAESGEETDLIPLVMTIAQSEKTQLVARNYSSFFINTAQAKTWQEVGSCAMKALGADILFSLAQSSATAWTKSAIKSAFKTVAKRMLGPIGVAVAVVEFTWCLAG